MPSSYMSLQYLKHTRQVVCNRLPEPIVLDQFPLHAVVMIIWLRVIRAGPGTLEGRVKNL